MRSSVVVSSWWSNSLALTCLARLAAFAPGREIYVIQAGKSDAQMERFRGCLPRGVKELPYPTYVLPDDWAMREYLAKDALRDTEGAWFFDHDTFLQEPADQWFCDADARFSSSGICLCTRPPGMAGGGVTQPAYWLAPLRWPSGLSSFAPVPFEPKPHAGRPDLHRTDGNWVVPTMDTLSQVRNELEAMGMVGTFALEPDHAEGHLMESFPPHIHIGGIYLYTGPTRPRNGMPPAFFTWRRRTLLSFDAFFRNCPQEWLAIEEPELLRRHGEMMSTLETLP